MRPMIPRGAPARALASVLLSLGLLAACADNRTPDEHLARAEDYLAEGERASAIIELKNALQKNPDLAAARLKLGTLLAEGGDPAAAEKELRRALTLGSDPLEARPPLARALLRQGEYAEVLEETDTLMDDNTLPPLSVYVSRGRALRSTDREAEGCASFEAALARDETYVPARLGRARCAAQQSDWERAQATLDTVLADNPHNLDAYYLRARINKVRGDWTQALAAYERAAEIDPEAVPALTGSAEVLLRQDRIDAAATQVERALSLDAGNLLARHLSGVIAFHRNQLREAISTFERLVSERDHAASRLWLAMAYYVQKSPARAEQHVRSFLRDRPDSGQGRYLLGLIQANQGRDAEAAETFAELSRNDRLQEVGLSSNVARALMASGNNAGAIDYLKKLLAESPGDDALRKTLATALMAEGSTAEAEQQLLRLGQGTDSDAASARLLLVQNLIRQGKLEDAARMAAETAERWPGLADAHLIVGSVALLQDRNQAAAEAFDAALAIDERSVGALHGQGIVAYRQQRPEAAADAFRRILEQEPGHRRALLAMYALSRAQGNPSAALGWLAEAAEHHPSDAGIQAAYARGLLEAGAPGAALDTLAPALSANPDSIRLLELRAMALRMSGRPGDAADIQQGLAQREPAVAGRWVDLADSHRAAGHLDEARSAVSEALALQSDHQRALTVRFRIELADGNRKAADDAAKDLIAAAPERFDGYRLRIQLLAGQGEWERALDVLEAGEEAVGRSSQTVMLAARLLRQRGWDDAAVRRLTRWVKGNPDDLRVRRELAGTLADSGQREAAAEHYKAVLEAEPNDTATLNNLAVLETERDPERALTLARRASEHAPDDPRLADTLGWALVANGRPEEALEPLRRAHQALEHPTVAYHYAVALARTGGKDEARAILTAVTKAGTAFPERNAARDLLADLDS